METRSIESYLASDDANEWRYSIAPSNQKVSLKTIGGIQTTGIWDGKYGEAFIAWAPLIKADKYKEELLAQHRFKYTWDELIAKGFAVEQPAPDLYAATVRMFGERNLAPYGVKGETGPTAFSPMTAHYGRCEPDPDVDTHCSRGTVGCVNDMRADDECAVVTFCDSTCKRGTFGCPVTDHGNA